ncbi:hypothetical protein M0811_10420 [Anaeramoeba ignava]|uniref:Uncharacterized protein n=1 Tax=Anaeramoeba ignava TaxID=1746090 RepID=A0A9Q0LEQ3_ANAIG|nr:hypothetical protein M0811_10420 [Anaeramoeba ignava]|eukprot:Anaeramoba_ignava/a219137_31.p1 GENE.a219137_31~~a219137_31.p1  ORF type:complete len:375 (+),score=93.22 a219137_31:22-1146(+)
MNDAAIGYLSSFIAALFFGTNYVPVNRIQDKLGDGIIFQWFMCSGIEFVGIISLFLSSSFTFVPSGLLGGMFWTIGNLCVPIIFELVGLGVGFLFWSGGNLLMGYFVGRFGWFGVPKESIKSQPLSAFGIIFGIGTLITFFFIKPNLNKNKTFEKIDKQNNQENENQENKEIIIENQTDSENQNTENTINPSERTPFLLQVEERIRKSNENRILLSIRRLDKKTKHILGVGLATFIGLLYGVNLVPMKIWTNQHPSAGLFDFIFSQFTGIFFSSTIVMVIYSILSKPIYPMSVFFPSFISGIFWAIACASWVISTAKLGFVVGYPIVVVGPIFITSIWSILYFKEIRGKRNFLFLSASYLLLVLSITFLILSRT